MMTDITADIAYMESCRRILHTVRIFHLDGRLFASAGFISSLHSERWDWIVEAVANECDCDPDDIDCIESDEGDLITVDGIPLFKYVS